MSTRLSRMDYPAHKLNEQFRDRSIFAEFPNKRIYYGELKSHSTTSGIPVYPEYLEAMVSLVPVATPTIGPVAKVSDEAPNDSDVKRPNNAATIDYENLVISVKGSTC